MTETGSARTEAGPIESLPLDPPEADPMILVVGSATGFSNELVEYAVWFAKRLGYHILALNSGSFGHEAPKVLEPYEDELRKGMEKEATSGAALFRARATAEEVPFRHVVCSGSPERCTRDLFEANRSIAYILTEPEEQPAGMDFEPAIPVFSYSR